MSRVLAALLAGVLCGIGLSVAGMVDPHKVLGFLDVRGDWISRRPNVRPGGWAFQYNNDY
jgi:uncharacterized membrane protein YedE/YeeE